MFRQKEGNATNKGIFKDGLNIFIRFINILFPVQETLHFSVHGLHIQGRREYRLLLYVGNPVVFHPQ